MNFAIARQKLLNEVIRPSGIQDPRLIKAMEQIPRHWFVDEAFAMQAYADNSLPIGHNQTISKPSVVARMLQSANLGLQDRVLEIGTGSGYQTAILSRLVRRVFSVEIFEEFILRVRPLLAKLDCWNVSLRKSNGYLGLPEESPFDVIVVSACFPRIPEELMEQLNPRGGRLVSPVMKNGEQRIRLIILHGEQRQQLDLGPCIFVPMQEKERQIHC